MVCGRKIDASQNNHLGKC